MVVVLVAEKWWVLSEKLQLAPDMMTRDSGQKDDSCYILLFSSLFSHIPENIWMGDPKVQVSFSWNGDTFVQIRSKIFWTSVGKSGCREKRRKTLSTRVVVVAEEVRRQNS